MIGAVLSELGKTTSLRSPVLCLLGVVPTTAVVAFALGNDAARAVGPGVAVSPVGPAAGALHVAIMVLAAAATLVVTSEYQGGTIRSTFIAQPRRGRVVAAKALVTALLGAMVGVLSGGAALAAAVLGTGTGAGADATAGLVLRAAVLFAVVGPLVTGVGFALRRSVGVLVAAVAVLVGGLALPETVGRWTAAGGASAFLAGTSADYPAVVGLVVVASWAGAAMAVGALVVTRRDV